MLEAFVACVTLTFAVAAALTAHAQKLAARNVVRAYANARGLVCDGRTASGTQRGVPFEVGLGDGAHGLGVAVRAGAFVRVLPAELDFDALDEARALVVEKARSRDGTRPYR